MTCRIFSEGCSEGGGRVEQEFTEEPLVFFFSLPLLSCPVREPRVTVRVRWQHMVVYSLMRDDNMVAVKVIIKQLKCVCVC